MLVLVLCVYFATNFCWQRRSQSLSEGARGQMAIKRTKLVHVCSRKHRLRVYTGTMSSWWARLLDALARGPRFVLQRVRARRQALEAGRPVHSVQSREVDTRELGTPSTGYPQRGAAR